MKMKRRRNRNDLRRRGPSRDSSPRVLVVCEGERTEPLYLEAFAADEKNGLINVEAVGLGWDPRSLVDEAARRRKKAERESKREGDANLRYDDVWCVFDIDSAPRERRVPEAREAAAARNIALGISNPSFELWAVLHYQEFDRPCTQDEIARTLKTHSPGYHKDLPYEKMRGNYETAVTRAKALLERRDKERNPEGNPSTGVHRLTERIRQFGRRKRLERS